MQQRGGVILVDYPTLRYSDAPVGWRMPASRMLWTLNSSLLCAPLRSTQFKPNVPKAVNPSIALSIDAACRSSVAHTLICRLGLSISLVMKLSWYSATANSTRHLSTAQAMVLPLMLSWAAQHAVGQAELRQQF